MISISKFNHFNSQRMTRGKYVGVTPTLILRMRITLLSIALMLVTSAAAAGKGPTEIQLRYRSLSTIETGISKGLTRQLRLTRAQEIRGFVRLTSPLDPKLRDKLSEQGVELLFEVETPIWVAKLKTKALQKGKLPAGIAWADEIRGKDKISESLLAKVPQWAQAGGGLLRLTVEFFQDADDLAVQRLLQRNGQLIKPFGLRNSFYILAKRKQMRTLAASNEVKWIEPGPIPFTLLNNSTRRVTGVEITQRLETGPAGAPPAIYHGRTGDGVQVGIFDSGVDPFHSGFRQHDPFGVETGDRLLRRSAIRAPHGTQVAGIAAGDGIAGDGCSTPSYRQRGMAPGAEIISISPTARFGPLALEFEEGISDFGMDLSNHSYELTLNGQYDTRSRNIDALIAGTRTSGGTVIPPRPQIWAIGNKGAFAAPGRVSGYFSTLAPAKNAIAVGSSRGDVSSVIDRLSSFSSLGPTQDGRLKPEIVAPGSNITTTQQGTDCYTDFAEEGTSLSAPVVTGISALAYDQYAETYRADLEMNPPLPSTLKALLVQSAVDLVHAMPDRLDWINPDTGAPVLYHPGPDWATGYGRVDAPGAVGVVTEKNLHESQISGREGIVNLEFHVAPLRDKIQFTLAWDDPVDESPFSMESASHLVNDLDISIFGPDGTEYLPWVLSPLTPAATLGDRDPILASDIRPATKGRDHRNNLEQVTIDSPSPAGLWQVRISAGQASTSVFESPQKFSVAGDFHGRIHFTDWFEFPGSVYAIKDGRQEPIFTADGVSDRIHHSAFSPDGTLYISNGNTNNIVAVTPGQDPEEVFNFDTFTRDIGFDPDGNFYFSQASGVTENGAIYRLDLISGDVELHYTVQLPDIGGRWAGDFTFSPSGELYISSGNVIGGTLFRVDDLTLSSPPVPVYELADESITGIAFDRDGQLFFTNWDADGGHIWRLFLADGSRDLVYSFPGRAIWDVSFR